MGIPSFRNRTTLRTAVPAIAALAAFLFPLAGLAAPPDGDTAVPAILSGAESLFLSMRDRDYRGIFAVLTAKSRDTIVGETRKAIAAAGGNTPSADEIRRDFEEGGPLARNYWDAFLRRFDPQAALERSRWEMGPVKKDLAEVLITKHGVQHPAVLKMYREEGIWKAGLVETFWTR